MKIIKQYLSGIYLLLAVLLIVACNPSGDSANVDGKYIQSIARNTIKFEDGSTYTLPQDTSTKIIYLIRHAEKDTSVQNNPSLSNRGVKRSQNLERMLQGTQIDKIFSTMYNRTILTVSDVAAAKGMKIEPYKPAGMRQLAIDILSGNIGQRFLIVGHSNTTKSMVNVLLSDNFYTDGIDESDYDNFYIVLASKEKNEVLALKYK
jgi:phosphohistidine phosphatase SixA